MLYQAKTLNGFKLKGLDGEIGQVKNFFFDDKRWVVRYLIAETGNWLLSRQVLISPYALSKVDWDEQAIAVKLTKKQIEDSPSIDTERPVSQQFEIDYSEYYAYPYYWTGMNTWGDYPYMWGAYPYALPTPDQQKTLQSATHKWDAHLRSAQEVRGYHVHAADGEIGHIEDFIVDDENWSIKSLIIDTVNWWPGKKVLVSPRSIEQVSWENSIVVIQKTREEVKNSRPFNGDVNSQESHYPSSNS